MMNLGIRITSRKNPSSHRRGRSYDEGLPLNNNALSPPSEQAKRFVFWFVCFL